MTDPSSSPWKRAVAWVIPLLLWGAWLGASLKAASSASNASGQAEIQIGQDLTACLDFAKVDFSTPDPVKEAGCRSTYDQAVVRFQSEQRERTGKLRIAEASAAAAVVVALICVVRVPRRFQPGVPGVILAIVLALALGGGWLLFALSNMPHLG
jgi:hypothetical protein